MAILKKKLDIDELNKREREQRLITAQYLEGKFGEGEEAVKIYRSKMDTVATPLDLVELASKLNFRQKK